MLSRCRLVAHLLFGFALGFGTLLVTSGPLFAAGRDPLDQPLYDIVAVGRGHGQILLATLAIPAKKLEWRFRKISVSPADQSVADVSLSSEGTKALVIFADGTSRVFNLTKPLTGITAGDVPAPQYRLPHQIFPYAHAGPLFCGHAEICGYHGTSRKRRQYSFSTPLGL